MSKNLNLNKIIIKHKNVLLSLLHLSIFLYGYQINGTSELKIHILRCVNVVMRDHLLLRMRHAVVVLLQTIIRN